jgi:hypothetical protein
MAGGNQVPVAKPVAKPAAAPAPADAGSGDLAGPLADGDNAGPGYEAYRGQASTDDLIAQARARMATGQDSAPATAAAAGPAADAPASAAEPAGQSVHADGAANPAGSAGSIPGSAVVTGQADGQQQPMTALDLLMQLFPAPVAAIPDAKETATALGKDAGMTAVETPRAVGRGFMQAAGSLLQVMTHLGVEQISTDPFLSRMTPAQQEGFAKLMNGEIDARTDAAAGVIGEPKSAGGKLIANAVQFIALMGTGARAAQATIGLTDAGANMIGSAASMGLSFKGADPTVAEMIQANPKLANPIAEFMASKPGDNEAVARLKNAFEGMVGDALLTPLIAAFQLFKASKAPALAQEGAAAAPSKILTPGLTPEDLKVLGDAGDTAAPIVSVKPRLDAKGNPIADPMVAGKLQKGLEATDGTDAGAAAEGLATDAQANRLSAAFGAPTDFGNKAVTVNFARINTEADVKTALGQMTEAFSDSIDAAKRGVRSNEVTQQAADDLGMSVADLLRRRGGQPLNAEEGLAARNLWAASGQKLLETAQAAAAPGATAADLYAFRKMMATHYAIQAEVLGARAETARALQAWSIPAGGGQEQMKALEAMLAGSGGADVSKAMAQRLALLAESGADQATLNQAIRKGAFAKTMDAVREIWINGLLSSPTTHIVNTVSNLNVALQQPVERYVAGKIAQMTGSGGVADGEGQAMIYGMLSGLGDAFRVSWKTARGQATDMLGKLEQPSGVDPAISSAAFNLDEAGGPGRVVDLLGNVFRVPGKALETQDAFFKSIGYRMELNAQAYRQAASEGLQGDALGQRVADIVANPPENIRLASADAALYNTFTNENGWFGKWLSSARNKGGPLNPMPFIIPFVRTPVNIARYSFERTPLAPLVGQWRADIAAGGARRDLALARMATGSSAMALATDYAMQGLVTGRGPKDPGELATLKRTGWQPYSIKVGDKWVSYNRLDPFGQTLGFAADMTEAMSRGDIDPADVDSWNELMAGGIAAVSQFTINKTYLKGMADFANVMTDPDRYGRDYVNNFAASFLPFTAASGAVERVVDPTNRETFTPMDALYARMAGLSDQLIPSRDLWGKPTQSGGAVMPGTVAGRVFDAVTPMQVKQAAAEPIDAEMLKQRVYQLPIGKKSSFAGVDVDFRNWPQVYDAYVQLAGNGAKDPAFGMGAKDYLNALVSGKHELSKIYDMQSDGPEGGKAKMIKSAILDARQRAQQQILADPKFAAFADYIKTQQGINARAKMMPSVSQSMPQVQ